MHGQEPWTPGWTLNPTAFHKDGEREDTQGSGRHLQWVRRMRVWGNRGR